MPTGTYCCGLLAETGMPTGTDCCGLPAGTGCYIVDYRQLGSEQLFAAKYQPVLKLTNVRLLGFAKS